MADWQDYPGAAAGPGHTVVGSIRRLASVESPQLGNQRDIYVYLPPGYSGSERRYPVVYMHDGQNLFDKATAFGEEWNVDATLEAASAQGVEAIVVGIPNTGDGRCDEYSPFIDAKRGGGQGDAYLRFLLETVKPLVDAAFRTEPGRDATGIMGSSMGGLISLYAFFHHPESFGFAGFMSPALWFADRAIFPWLALVDRVPGRLYLDVGTLEGSTELLDVAKMREMLVAKGYRRGLDMLCVVEPGGRHTEAAWGRRFGRALRFLLALESGRADMPAAQDG